jgi:hypothetical protein
VGFTLILLRRLTQGVFPVFPNHEKQTEAGAVVRLPLRLFICCMLGLLCIACGDPNDIAEDISVTPVEELILTQETHPDGWGLTECIFCHPLFKIHLKTSDPRVDLEKIHEVVDRLGQDSCIFCHGPNGT